MCARHTVQTCSGILDDDYDYGGLDDDGLDSLVEGLSIFVRRQYHLSLQLSSIIGVSGASWSYKYPYNIVCNAATKRGK
jgi:hypothetical protein